VKLGLLAFPFSFISYFPKCKTIEKDGQITLAFNDQNLCLKTPTPYQFAFDRPTQKNKKVKKVVKKRCDLNPLKLVHMLIIVQ